MSVYLDHAATTPMVPAAVEAVTAELVEVGNPSSLHAAGRRARALVEEARESLAADLGAHPTEVVLTSGGTEADNLAVLGTYRARRLADPRRCRLVVSSVEHHAVLDSVEHLVAHEGATVTWVDPGRDGVVTPDAVRAALLGAGDAGPETVALVSVMWAGNEVGVVQPVAEIVDLVHGHGIPVHSDAVQAFGHVPLDVAVSGVDLLTVTAHKLGGPVGIGALVARRDAMIQPVSHGGGQERDLRSGTVNAAGARGFAVAAHTAVTGLVAEAERLVGLRDRLIRGALALPGVAVTGAWTSGDTRTRLPGNVHLLIDGCDGDALLYLLDTAGVCASTGSACRAGVGRPSHVVLAMGHPESVARGALRLSLGHTTTDADVDAVLDALPGVVDGARRAAAVAS